MPRKVLLAGVIGLIVIVAAVIVVGYSGQRTVYTPVNMLGSAPVNAAAVNVAIAATSIPVDQPITSLDNAPIQTGDGIIYTVQTGETLYRIALQYNLTAEDVARANGLTDLTQIYAGQTLTIPVQPLPDGSLPVFNTPTPLPPVSVQIDPNITYPPMPGMVNGIPIESIVVMPEGVVQHIRNIYSMGQSLGRNPHAFSKLGDSTIENPHFLARFDSSPYDLGDYSSLQPAISFFYGSFGRDGAVRRGLHTWAVLDPMWTGSACPSGQHMLACEFQANNPSILIIHLGSNDAGVPESTNQNFREIIDYCLNAGVIPILGTKADRHEGSNINNEIIRKIAFDYNLPLWDFDLVASTIAGKGLDQDNVHMTSFFAHDWRQPEAFERGYGLMNLTALIALDKVWEAINPQA